MPHEVIMPALGMAQDTGLIVGWLKQPGDAVKAGDPLMEVETDKATMEVEAAHDGYLVGVRAAAGDSVPVGDVVALIADSPEDADAAPNPPAISDKAAAGTPAPARAKGNTVIMPALGMAQDTGLIVAWLKQPGDKVAATDPLLEVETDKSTMEVEAGHDGWIAELIGKAGQDIPVGDVIAVISDSEPAAPIHRSAGESPTAPKAASVARDAPATVPAQTKPEKSNRAPTPRRRDADVMPTSRNGASGRILASPRARRLAAEQGLDLGRLVAAGHPQPYHVADLEVLRNLPESQEKIAPTVARAVSEITADVPAPAFDAFVDWLATEAPEIPQIRVLAAFSTAALRHALGDNAPLTVGVAGSGTTALQTDADLAPLSAPLPDAGHDPALVIRDLTGSALTGIRPGSACPPLLTLTRRNGTLSLTLSHDDADLTQDAAIALVTGLSARLADPLRHLL